MKILFMSDIHGSYDAIETINKLISFEELDKIVLLGDLLYHGPRNPLPKGYDCMAVANCLNKHKNKIIAVRGNCDSEVDQMVLEFDIMKDYLEVDLNGLKFFITHGHLFDQSSLPNKKFDVFIHGHYHIPVIEDYDNKFIINPSSIALPKEGERSFGILEDTVFSIIDLEGNVVRTKDLIRLGA